MRCYDCRYYWKEAEEIWPACHWKPGDPGGRSICVKFYAHLSRRWRTIEIGGSREQLIKDLRDMKKKGILTDEDSINIYAVLPEGGGRAYISVDEETTILKEAGL